MSVLVDSTVWSVMLRRKSDTVNTDVISALQRLIRDKRAMVIGAIRQEVLAGVRDASRFQIIKDKMRAFPDIAPSLNEYESAGAMYTACVNKGIKPSHVDMLICAMAVRHDLEIFTLDKDFNHYARAIPIRQYSLD